MIQNKKIFIILYIYILHLIFTKLINITNINKLLKKIKNITLFNPFTLLGRSLVILGKSFSR